MKHPDVRYEKSDATVGMILAFGLGLVIVGLVVHVTVAWMFDAFKEAARREGKPLPTLTAKERVKLPRDLQKKVPPPRLQQNERADLERLRREEARRLNT